MPRYHLATIKNKEIKIFDIENIEKSKAEDSLQLLDMITMRFLDEQSLIKYLVSKKMYDKKNDKKLHVVYRNKGKDKKLPVLYSDCYKFMDLSYLRPIINSLSKDITFLEKLANHYGAGKSTYNTQLANVQILRGYINDVRFSESGEPFFAQRVYDALNDIIIKAVYRVNEKTGEIKVNYRGFRDLALFIKKYTDKLLDKELEGYTEKNDSKFTYNENYDEPDFPPYSEEEEMYLKYIDSLEDEESDYSYEKGKNL